MSMIASSRIKVMFAVLASALFLAACGGGGGGSSTPGVTLQSIAVTPQGQSSALNSRVQLTATGTYSDNTTQNITTSVTWSSSNSALATVGANTGLVTPVAGAAASPVTLTATSGALTASTTITLTAIPIYTLVSSAEPLAAQQWGLLNTGQNGYADTNGLANTGGTLGTDINANPVYSTYGYTGWGVTVAVVDSGLEIAHEDLSANVVPGGSWNFINNSTNPTNTATTGDHGTSVSGLIAMAKNGIGGVGVAPNAQLKGFNFLGSGVSTIANEIVSLGGSSSSPNSSDVAIFNLSFGTANTTDTPIAPTLEAHYIYGTSSLRGGKGALYVKSAGNGFAGFGTADCTGAPTAGISCQNANFDPANTLPYNIVVAALNANGLKSSYSTTGSAIWVSAPGGEFGENASVSGGSGVSLQPAMVTTDQSNCLSGYSATADTTSLFNRGGSNVAGVNASCNYTNNFNGTSSAAPMMSGVIALILEANPALTWREVKDILARTSVQVDSGNLGMTGTVGGVAYDSEQGWVTNHALPTGFKFHNWYGFGAVNASAAVALARTYSSGSLGTFTDTGWITATLPGSTTVPDNSTVGVSVPISVPRVGVSGVVEAVQIKVTTSAGKDPASTTGCTTAAPTDGCTADIAIELTSPAPHFTKSILKNIRDGFDGFYLSGMVLASNAFYGETNTTTGTWTVKVIDGWSGSGNQTVTDVKIRVYGH